MINKHLLINVYNIIDIELLNNDDIIDELINKIVSKFNFTIKDKLYHRFDINGKTIVYLLDDYNLTIHTFPLIYYCAIDMYIDYNIVFDKK